MNWIISYLPSGKIIRAAVNGELTAQGIAAMEAEMLEESKRCGINLFLCDCRGVAPNINISELYDLPARLRQLGLNSDHKVALVYSPEPHVKPLFTFLDDRSYNVGLNQKVFPDYDGACAWLATQHKDAKPRRVEGINSLAARAAA
jgi:hypothetical protein